MGKPIVIGIDGSDCCARAVDVAAGQARTSGVPLLVVLVIEWSRFSFNTPEENEQRHRRREEEIALAHKRVLDPLVEKLRGDGVDAEGIVRHGHVAEVLSQIAGERDAAQIFIGRIGQSPLRTALFGSVAATLVQVSTVPVTVVP